MSDSLITTQETLHALCAHLRSAPWIALDTEFMRERTYYARLCLIQIATPEQVACVDPLALPDLDPLLAVLYDPAILKVLHSARQDLEVFFDLRGRLPGPVFDTQIAAAYLGYDDQIGYGALVEEVTGVKLDKAHTRANWAARPLSPEQIRYAEDDVRYLRDVYLHLADRLRQAQRLEWLTPEFAQMLEPALYRNAPEDAWRRIKHGHQLTPAAQNVLQALCAWRERSAQTHDLPRSWVLRDPAMFDIARRAPQTAEQLARIHGIDDKSLRKWSAEILEVVRASAALPPHTWWPAHVPLTSTQADLSRRLAIHLDATAARLRISAAALATRRDLQRLVLGARDLPLLQGWRHEVVGRELLAMVEGTGCGAGGG